MTLHRIFILTAVATSISTLVGLTALLTSSHFLVNSSEELTESIASIDAAHALQINLGQHHRQSLLKGIEPQEVRREVVLKSTKNIFANLDEAAQHIGDAEEQKTFDIVKRDLLTYLHHHDELRKKGLTSTELYKADSENYALAVESIRELVDVNVNSAKKVQKAIIRQQGKNQKIVGLAVVLLLAGLLAFLFITRRYLYNPLKHLRSRVESYNPDQEPQAVRVIGVEEIKTISSTFDNLAQRIFSQRETQLTFLAAIAHDLRNPLGAIRMATDVLLENPGQADQKMTLEIINRQASLLNRLVEDLLDRTRIEAGKLDLRSEIVDLKNLLRDSVELYSSTSNRHEIILQAPDDSLRLYADPARLSQVFNNLISNAIKYSPKGGKIMIHIRPEGDDLVISFEDTGIGISAQDHTAVFEPFHRTDTTKKTIPGIGLGLSISRKIVEAHGGTIDFKSIVGVGTCFVIRLPTLAPKKRINREDPSPQVSL